MSSPSTPLSTPPDALLRRYLLGQTSEAEADSIEQYLARHPEHAERLPGDFVNDDLLRALRAPHSRLAPSQPQARELMERLERLAAGDLTLPIGSRVGCFGDYELLAELGRGGMGVVFKARQISLQRPVALKMILAGKLASSDAVQRFRSEAEAAARLDHPHIVPVYEVGEHQDQHYFSMKLIYGRTLAERIGEYALAGAGRGAAFPGRQTDQTAWEGRPTKLSACELRARESQIAALVAKLADAVHHAHQRGVLHRDLKPANVLIDAEGEPHISDFGLAKRTDNETGLTVSGDLIGTPAYMAPEQAAGRSDLTTAVDVFALGAVLYELLTGGRLFQGESTARVLRLVAEVEPLRPRSIQPRIARDLETICLKCLAKEPAHRYASADALAADLRRFLAGEPILARPAGAREKLLKWARRKPAAAAMAIVSIAAVATLTAGLAVSHALVSTAKNETERALADRTAALDERTAALDERTAALEREQRASYFKTIALAYRDVLDYDANHALELLEQCGPEHRNWEWYYLARICRGAFQHYPAGGSNVLDIAVSPDGKFVAALSAAASSEKEDGLPLVLRVFDAATWRELTTQALDDIHCRAAPRSLAASSGRHARTTRLAFSRDGLRLAVSGAGPPGRESFHIVRCFDTESWRELTAMRATFTGRSFVTVCPTAQSLAVVAVPDAPDVGSDELVSADVLDLDTGKGIIAVSVPPPVVDAVASENGSWLAICARQVYVVDFSRNETIRPQLHAGSVPTCIALNPSGDRLAVGDASGNIALFETFGGAEQCFVRAHGGGTSALAFSHQGDLLVSVGMDRMLRVADGETLAERKRMLGLRGFARRVAFGANDAEVVADEGPHGSLTVLPLNLAAPQTPLWKGSDEVCCDSTPDGKWLAMAPVFRSSVAIWDVERPAWKYTTWDCYPPGVVPTCLAISPDGRRFAMAGRDQQMSPGPNVPKLWNCATGELELSFPATEENISALSFDTDGSRLAWGTRDKTVRVWQVPNSVWNGLRAVPGEGGSEDGLPSPSRKGFRVQGSAEENEISEQGGANPKSKIQNPKSPDELWHITARHEIVSLATRPGADELAIAESPLEGGSDARVFIVDLCDGRAKCEVPLRWPSVQIVRYSSDARRLLIGAVHDAATYASEVVLCDARDGRVLGRYRGTSSGVTGAAISSDGQRLFGVFRDGNVVIWDVATGEEALVLRGARNQLHGLALTRDGLLVTAGHENLFNFWDGRPVK